MKNLSTDIRREIRQKLESRKKALIQTKTDYQVEAKPEPRKDIPDLANEELKFNIASSLADHELHQINEINGALERLEKGTYGFCESCDEAISAKRLRALPEAKLCITCSRERENLASTSQHMSRV